MAKKSASAGGENLLIVESPAKAKTIKKFLGGSFTVKASMGHVRDITSKGRGKDAFGIDFENGYAPRYEPLKTREKVLRELREAAAKADAVYLAPDPDREGEAIAWHLKEALDLSERKTHRVTFNAITRNAVQEAIRHPGKIDMNLVNAQQGRRVLDRLVGFSLSPFLWKKITKGLSAGRVQSVAVRLIVEREREIGAFKPEEFWRIVVDLVQQDAQTAPPPVFQASLVRWKGEKFELGSPHAANEEAATAVADALQDAAYTIKTVDKREVKGRPTPPFITSTLQQAASTFLYFGTQKTMRVAQSLYEGVTVDGTPMGLITYMRTDSTRIAPEALAEAREYIGEHFDPEYLPAKANVYSSKKGAQDAHEAIRPTSVLLTPTRVKPFLNAEQFRLYDLIWRRFVASQMSPARYQTTTATILAADGELEAKGRVVLFDGHTILSMQAAKAARKDEKHEEDGSGGDPEETGKENKDQTLPPLREGDDLEKTDLRATQHFTQPPPRYTEASLVKTLEKEGIGRPSTYASIVQTIQDRGYTKLVKRAFHATELGMAVTDLLLKHFDQIMDLQFTARMEADLDSVEEGKSDWVKLIDEFYKPFEKRLGNAVKEAEPLKGKPAPNGETCPLCESEMLVRYSKAGAFLGCSKFPECKGLRQMPGEEGDAADLPEGELVSCPACGAPMQQKKSRFGDFLACSGYPVCKQTIPLGKDGKPVPLPDIKMDCGKCGAEMVVKMGKNGPFLACSGYPACKNTKHLDREGKVIELPEIKGILCEKCGAEMIVRMSRRGPFLACPGFPKCRNAKPMPGEEKKASKKTAKKTAKKSTKKTTKTITRKSTSKTQAPETDSSTTSPETPPWDDA